ncbi:MAG: hypothetical protein LBG80_10390 [Bacteroidales bacterium]|jgi:hypothetical protein|nr:hypothetical protein [Bacteroidales bacterium]
MRVVKVFICLMFMAFTHVLVAQEQSESLSFTSGTWSHSYYAGSQQISYKDFMNRLKTGSDVQVPRMFESGINLSVTGTIIGSIGAFGFGYDLGTRLAGAKGNTKLLVGGGSVMVAGIIMYYVGEGKMKKAMTLYSKNTVALNINLNSGLGLCLNF